MPLITFTCANTGKEVKVDPKKVHHLEERDPENSTDRSVIFLLDGSKITVTVDAFRAVNMLDSVFRLEESVC